jgi:hypothetical protein
MFGGDDDLIVSAQGSITPMPCGWKEAAIVDWFPIGIQSATYRDQTGEDVRKDVQQFCYVCEFAEAQQVFWPERRFNATTGNGSSLLEMLEGLLDRALTDAERRRFSVKSLVGKACRIRIDLKEEGPKVYFNITKWAPAGPEPYRPSGQYFRRELADWERAGLAKARGETTGQQPGERPPQPRVPFKPKPIAQLLQAAPSPAASTENRAVTNPSPDAAGA